jgi:DICT domain-containing protein
MEPADKIQEQEKKIKNLELELNDLRQGLTVVADYYRDLRQVSRQQVATEIVDQDIARPIVDEDREFEGIWRFHEEVLVPDPAAHVPCPAMYEAFIRYCRKTGRKPVEQEAFEFVFARMENPSPLLGRGEWTGYRLRLDRV